MRPGAQVGLHDVRGGGLGHVAGRRGEEQQVDVERVEVRLPQGRLRGAGRQGGRVLARPDDVTVCDAAHRLEESPRQPQRAGALHPVLEFRRRDHLRRQVCGRGGDPHPRVCVVHVVQLPRGGQAGREYERSKVGSRQYP